MSEKLSGSVKFVLGLIVVCGVAAVGITIWNNTTSAYEASKQDYEAKLAEKNMEITSLNSEIANRDELIKGLNTQNEALKEDITKLQATHTKKKTTIRKKSTREKDVLLVEQLQKNSVETTIDDSKNTLSMDVPNRENLLVFTLDFDKLKEETGLLYRTLANRDETIHQMDSRDALKDQKITQLGEVNQITANRLQEADGEIKRISKSLRFQKTLTKVSVAVLVVSGVIMAITK